MVTAVVVFNLFSKNTKEIPNINEIKVNKRYRNLKTCSEFTFLINVGILPSINPIKQKLACAGNVLNRAFNILPNKKTPTIPPSPIGKR